MSAQKKKSKVVATAQLPEIPQKLYFTIGEVGRLCDLRPHVLRYWEEEFSQLRPMKRRGNRRYYQKEDVELVRTIRELLYLQGFTIEGARQQLALNKRRAASKKAEPKEPLAQPNTTRLAINPDVVSSLEQVLGELEEV